MNRAFAALAMILLLAPSCSRKVSGGVPYILYEIHGKVVDKDGNPIKDIVVFSGDSEKDRTSGTGEFVVFGKSSPTAYAVVTCEDKDGEENGGSFTTTNTSVELHFRSAGSGNNKGNYFASEVEITMIPKEDSIQGGFNPPDSH